MPSRNKRVHFQRLITTRLKLVMECLNKNLVKVGLKPLHPCTACFFYLPIKGTIAYTVLSTQMLCPEAYENFKFIVIPNYVSLTNACLINSIVGSSLYLYSRPHLSKAPPKERISYCLFGAGMFNLGSMLLWALGRTVVPENAALRFIIGIAGAAGSLWFALKYVDFVDSQVPPMQPHHQSKK